VEKGKPGNQKKDKGVKDVVKNKTVGGFGMMTGVGHEEERQIKKKPEKNKDLTKN